MPDDGTEVKVFIWPFPVLDHSVMGNGTTEATTGTQVLVQSLSSGINMLPTAEQMLEKSLELFADEAHPSAQPGSMDHAGALNNLGVVYFATNRLERAVSQFRRAERLLLGMGVTRLTTGGRQARRNPSQRGQLPLRNGAGGWSPSAGGRSPIRFGAD